MKINFNGHDIEGSARELSELMQWMEKNPKDLYYSSSDGRFVRISTMHPNHARNALLKIYRQWTADLSELEGANLIDALKHGPTDNQEFLSLLQRYHDSLKTRNE